LGFDIVGYLTLFSCLTKVHFRLGSKFDVGFFQIPHWILRPVSLLLQHSVKVSLDTLASWSTYSLLLGVMIGFSPISDCPCRAQQKFKFPLGIFYDS